MTSEELLSYKADMPDKKIYDSTKLNWDKLAKPIDGLGELEKIICRIAAIQRKERPDISKKALIIMCGDNGVVCENVTQTQQSVTASVAGLMAHNQSSVGIMTSRYPLDIFTVDVGINSSQYIDGIINKRISDGTGNIKVEDAMSTEQCLSAVGVGIDMVGKCSENGYGMIATGEMGIGNTTTSTAVLCALTGIDPINITGRGAGLDDEGFKRKVDVIKQALKFHDLEGRACNVSPQYTIDVLSKVGGYDIAALTGVYIGAAIYHIPVVIDGFISAVAALAANYIMSDAREYMLASHIGREKGLKEILDILRLRAVIDANLALGEGSGAVLLFPILDMAFELYTNGTEFCNTDITQYERFSDDSTCGRESK